MLTVAEFNFACIRAYTKAGFREFGRRRQCRMLGENLWASVYLECLASEYLSAMPGAELGPDEARS